MEMINVGACLGGVLLLLAAAIALSFYYVNHLAVERYVLPQKEAGAGQAPIKIAFLTDIHDCLNPKRLDWVIHMLQEEMPDLILVGGDMMVKKQFHPERSLAVLKELAGLGQVYYANGNHERKLEIQSPEEMAEYEKELRSYGIHRLINGSSEVLVKGRKLHIYGINLPLEYYRKLGKPEKLTKKKIDGFLGAKKDVYTVLLAHHPRYFDAYADWGADLVLSGHIHGGVMRLPMVGGVLSPDVSFFPKYSGGMYREKGSVMIVSRGLGIHSIPFRLFNKPELSIIML